MVVKELQSVGLMLLNHLILQITVKEQNRFGNSFSECAHAATKAGHESDLNPKPPCLTFKVA